MVTGTHSSHFPLKIMAQKTISFIIFLLVAFFALILYISLSSHWVALGRGENIFVPPLFQFEIPFILLLLSFFHFSQIQNRLIRFLIPLVPIFILYVLFDCFYNFLERSPYPSDFQNFTSLWTFSPLMGIGIVLIFLSIPAVYLFLIYKASKAYSSNYFKGSLCLRTLFIVLTVLTLTTESFAHFHKDHFRYIVWSQEDTIKQNGKFSSFFYYNNLERENKKKLESISSQNTDIDIQETLFSGEMNITKNIHIIVLESFIDPRQIKGIKFSQPILAKELLPFLNTNGSFSLVTSPVYGGGTAQAEFELLTGVQALAKVNRIEFNVMQGGVMNGFVKKLNQNHYRTIATIASGAGFFNSKQAYKSLGFDEISFLEDIDSFKQQLSQGPVVDAHLLEYNISQLKKLIGQSDTPIFNYVLGMYGHLPYARNKAKRPDVVEVSHPDDRVKRIANQFYYRTKAIAHYIKQLMALDKDSIIYITSDHLPAILGEQTLYKLDNKQNISLFFNQNKPIDVSGKSYYQIPWFIWDLLIETHKPRMIKDKQMEAIYFQVLSESTQ